MKQKIKKNINFEKIFKYSHNVITNINTSNDPSNLAILCSLHHSMLHTGRLEIIGVFPSTKLPNGRSLVYTLDGIKNIDIEHDYVKHKVVSQKINYK